MFPYYKSSLKFSKDYLSLNLKCITTSDNIKILHIHYSMHITQFGRICVASTINNEIGSFIFCKTETEGIKDLNKKFPKATICMQEKLEHLQACNFLENKEYHSELHLLVCGTEFQCKVWQILLRIPVGKTVTYLDIALELGDSNCSRAVGNAVGKNPIAFLIPCHRVVQTSGKLGGYLWGLPKKRDLLQWELID